MRNLPGPSFIAQPSYGPLAGMGSFWGTVGDVFSGAVRVVGGIVQVAAGQPLAGIGTIVDAVTPDGESRRIGTTIVDAAGRVSTELAGGASAEEGLASVQDQLPLAVEIPDFVSWWLWDEILQIDPWAAQVFSVRMSGPVTSEEATYVHRHIGPAIARYRAIRGVAENPVMMHGHLVSVRTDRGGLIPIGVTAPGPTWSALNEAASAALTETIETTRARLQRMAEMARAHYAGGASVVVSPETPEGRFIPTTPTTEVAEDGFTIPAVLAAAAWLLL